MINVHVNRLTEPNLTRTQTKVHESIQVRKKVQFFDRNSYLYMKHQLITIFYKSLSHTTFLFHISILLQYSKKREEFLTSSIFVQAGSVHNFLIQTPCLSVLRKERYLFLQMSTFFTWIYLQCICNLRLYTPVCAHCGKQRTLLQGPSATQYAFGPCRPWPICTKRYQRHEHCKPMLQYRSHNSRMAKIALLPTYIHVGTKQAHGPLCTTRYQIYGCRKSVLMNE